MRKGFVQILILGVVITVLVAGGVYYLKQSKKAPVTSQPAAQLQSPSPVPSSIPDETANWKTYSNQYYSFKYPSNWDLETINSQKENSEVISSVKVHYHYTPDPSKGIYDYYVGDYVQLSVKSANNAISLDEEISPDNIKNGVIDMTSITKVVLDNVEGRRFNRAAAFGHDVVVVRKNGSEIEIDRVEAVDKTNKNSISKETFDKILSTFKFAN